MCTAPRAWTKNFSALFSSVYSFTFVFFSLVLTFFRETSIALLVGSTNTTFATSLCPSFMRSCMFFIQPDATSPIGR